MFCVLSGLDGSRVCVNVDRVLCCVKRLDRFRVLRSCVVVEGLREPVWVLEEPGEVCEQLVDSFGRGVGLLCSDLDGNGVVFNCLRVVFCGRGVDRLRRVGTRVVLDVVYYNEYWVAELPEELSLQLNAGWEGDEEGDVVDGDSPEGPGDVGEPVGEDEPTVSAKTLSIRSSVVVLGGSGVDLGEGG